ncbi:MAG TPA: DUF4271 domain-containing protein, partial [Bacteroidetes bacterium]|nr:DUF4271 domain-containing protein [Bacteroidota bacterium]
EKSKNSFKLVSKESANGSSGFLFWIFLFILVYIAILLTMNRNLVFKIFKAVWFYNLTNNLLRNFLNRDYLFYLLLSINFILNLATFVYLVFSKFEIYSGFHFWLLLVVAVLVVYFFKHLFIYLFQEVFSSLKSLTLYNFTVLLFNISLGFMLLPLNMIIAYGFDSLSFFLLYFTMGLMGLYLILRLFRGFLITYSYFNISIVHFFLYLCAFEILPLLFFYKLLTINL